MNIEKIRFFERNGLASHITLSKLAIPETVKVTLLGEPIIPVSFDYYGHPNFTQEQSDFFLFKQESLKKLNGGNSISLELEVIYEERIFDVPRRTFDTINGIEKALSSLSSLNELLQNRELFCKTHYGVPLNEFVLFGYILLEKFGRVMSLKKSARGKFISSSSIEDFALFKKNNKGGDFVFSTSTSRCYDIPTAGSFCPCCGKIFTIDDMWYNPCVCIDDKFYHDSCWSNYRRLKEVYKLTNLMMDLIYKESDYHFELLPNGYCQEDCCSHIPWILFHTIDGDIIIGWRKHVISIEWQKNYKPFDINKLFEKEDVTKWNENGKRGIHAWGNEKALQYLKKVLKAVNPNYAYKVF